MSPCANERCDLDRSKAALPVLRENRHPLARCLKRDCFAVTCRHCITTNAGELRKNRFCFRCGTRWPAEHDIAWFRPGGDLLAHLMKQLVAAGSRPVMSAK